MSSPSPFGGSLYGVLEFLVYKRKKAPRNSKFIMMSSPDQVGDDTRLRNFRFSLRNSRFLLTFRLDKSSLQIL